MVKKRLMRLFNSTIVNNYLLRKIEEERKILEIIVNGGQSKLGYSPCCQRNKIYLLKKMREDLGLGV